MDFDIKTFHPLEIKLLLNAEEENISAESLVGKLAFKPGQYNQAFSWLSAKKLIEEKEKKQRVIFEITDIGRDYQKNNTPAEKIFNLVQEKGGALTLSEISSILSLENKDTGAAFGQMSKEGIMALNEEKKVIVKSAGMSPVMKAVRTLLDKGVASGEIEESALTAEEKQAMSGISKKRGGGSAPFRIAEREDVVYKMTSMGMQVKKQLKEQGVSGNEIGGLTPEMLADGTWKNATFRSYNVNTPPARVLLGRHSPYSEFLDGVKDKLVSLGFEEFDGPLVETEFWNSDALFMPQFHSARDIHDVYYIEDPKKAKEIQQPYLDQVAEAHKNGWKTGSRGWGYDFDKEFTKRLILRSQGTVLSAKTLPKAKIPGKYFGIARCFRYDKVDATHLSDFYQTEGIVLGEDVNFKTLLGLLKMFAEEVAGATEVMYVPGYFPFTEPSVEIHIKHPVLGWFELGGSGIFRPEVTEPLGVHVPVLAWGLGIDRMALMSLGLNDLRELFTSNIESIRLRRSK
ncbi:MAG: phenylalanine--tRNA ligase subunit alpha [Spirochaetaceae bacterium]|nr:phenylalanine--tRNA ligase subunit alpha [Spirochaetaceae bacterium]